MLTPRTNHTPIYDIPLKSWDGQENFLDKYRGKVTLVINVTGHCGNAPQFGIIEEIYQKYKDQGFEVVAIPTNDFCGPGVTYGRYVDGIVDAADAREYGITEYNVTFDFSELIKSNMSDEWREKKNRVGDDIHPLYQEIDKVSVPTGGNFEKYLFNRDGHYVAHFANGALLDFANDQAKINESEISWEDTADHYYKEICNAIEEALAL